MFLTETAVPKTEKQSASAAELTRKIFEQSSNKVLQTVRFRLDERIASVGIQAMRSAIQEKPEGNSDTQ